MSKSYKKFTCFTDNQRGGAKFAKRQANKKVRKTFDIDNGCSYKKLYCQWNIHDYKSVYYSKQQTERIWYSYWRDPEPFYTDAEKSRNFPQWYKDFRRST